MCQHTNYCSVGLVAESVAGRDTCCVAASIYQATLYVIHVCVVCGYKLILWACSQVECDAQLLLNILQRTRRSTLLAFTL